MFHRGNGVEYRATGSNLLPPAMRCTVQQVLRLATNTVRVASFARVDAGARAGWPGGHAVQFGVRNLANLRYVEAVTAADDVFQGPLRQLWMTYTIAR